MRLYFRDNFFNAGLTEIVDDRQRPAGTLDLKGAFGSALDVYGEDGAIVCSGRFRMFSNKWEVYGADGGLLGVLRYRLSFLSKRYEYETAAGTLYGITSPAFSKEYEVQEEGGPLAARFERVSGWFSSGAYCLDNISGRLDSYELVAVIMGVHEIQKRHRQ